MTTTFHGILLGLGLLAIWAWLTVQLLKIKFGVVVNQRAKYHFDLETGFVRFVMFCLFISSMGLIAGSIIRLLRGI